MTWQTHESEHVNAPLKTIANARPEMLMTLEHVVLLPVLCPVSQNPAQGSTLTIGYAASARILELFALEAYIAAYSGHTLVRDMEYFVQTVGRECAKALGCNVHLCGEIVYAGLAQRQKISVTALPF
jgi:NADPH-dependent 7-cyano-7-deazaguanine reductase QueF